MMSAPARLMAVRTSIMAASRPAGRLGGGVEHHVLAADVVGGDGTSNRSLARRMTSR